MRLLNHVARVLQQLGQERLDAGETAMLARQLEFVYARTFDTKLPELKARKFIPVDTTVPTGAEAFTYRQWTSVGMANVIANYADDLPRADALAAEFTAPCRSLGSVYGYSIQDLRRAAMAGAQLDVARALAARRAIEQAIDHLAAFGSVDHGLAGFTNNANVPLVPPANAPWNTATSLEIVADLNALVNSIVLVTLETHIPDTLILDSASFSIVNTQPMSNTGDSDRTILRWFLENNPYIKNIDQWTKLTDAGAQGVTRCIAYQRSEEVLGLVISQEFEQLPPQAKNLAFDIPCHARVGGVSIRYPLAIAYQDGTGEA